MHNHSNFDKNCNSLFFNRRSEYTYQPSIKHLITSLKDVEHSSKKNINNNNNIIYEVVDDFDNSNILNNNDSIDKPCLSEKMSPKLTSLREMPDDCWLIDPSHKIINIAFFDTLKDGSIRSLLNEPIYTFNKPTYELLMQSNQVKVYSKLSYLSKVQQNNDINNDHHNNDIGIDKINCNSNNHHDIVNVDVNFSTRSMPETQIALLYSQLALPNFIVLKHLTTAEAHEISSGKDPNAKGALYNALLKTPIEINCLKDFLPETNMHRVELYFNDFFVCSHDHFSQHFAENIVCKKAFNLIKHVVPYIVLERDISEIKPNFHLLLESFTNESIPNFNQQSQKQNKKLKKKSKKNKNNFEESSINTLAAFKAKDNAITQDNIGFKLLAKMGWKGGDLGKSVETENNSINCTDSHKDTSKNENSDNDDNEIEDSQDSEEKDSLENLIGNVVNQKSVQQFWNTGALENDAYQHKLDDILSRVGISSFCTNFAYHDVRYIPNFKTLCFPIIRTYKDAIHTQALRIPIKLNQPDNGDKSEVGYLGRNKALQSFSLRIRHLDNATNSSPSILINPLISQKISVDPEFAIKHSNDKNDDVGYEKDHVNVNSASEKTFNQNKGTWFEMSDDVHQPLIKDFYFDSIVFDPHLTKEQRSTLHMYGTKCKYRTHSYGNDPFRVLVAFPFQSYGHLIHYIVQNNVSGDAKKYTGRIKKIKKKKSGDPKSKVGISLNPGVDLGKKLPKTKKIKKQEKQIAIKNGIEIGQFQSGKKNKKKKKKSVNSEGIIHNLKGHKAPTNGESSGGFLYYDYYEHQQRLLETAGLSFINRAKNTSNNTISSARRITDTFDTSRYYNNAIQNDFTRPRNNFNDNLGYDQANCSHAPLFDNSSFNINMNSNKNNFVYDSYYNSYEKNGFDSENMGYHSNQNVSHIHNDEVFYHNNDSRYNANKNINNNSIYYQNNYYSNNEEIFYQHNNYINANDYGNSNILPSGLFDTPLNTYDNVAGPSNMNFKNQNSPILSRNAKKRLRKRLAKHAN